MKKAFRLKLLELCKTRFRKSCPDMFNFTVVLTGRDWVTDRAGLTHPGGSSKPHLYIEKVQKMEDIAKTWILTAKQFEDFPRKKNKTHL